MTISCPSILFNCTTALQTNHTHFVTALISLPADSLQLSSYQQIKRKCASHVQQDEMFKKGLLLETVENGVTYPVVHLGPAHHFSSLENLRTNNETNVGDNCCMEHGLYQKLSSIQADLFGSALDDLVTLERGAQPSWRRFYLMLGFKQQPTLTYSKVLEIHWKDWTGARYLFLNLPDEFGLAGLTFYKRLNPKDANLFLYIVMVECVRVRNNDQVALQDFVQRMRADKMPFYLALYEEAEVQATKRSTLPLHFGYQWSWGGSTGHGSMESSLSDESPSSRPTTRMDSPMLSFSISPSQPTMP